MPMTISNSAIVISVIETLRRPGRSSSVVAFIEAPSIADACRRAGGMRAPAREAERAWQRRVRRAEWIVAGAAARWAVLIRRAGCRVVLAYIGVHVGALN